MFQSYIKPALYVILFLFWSNLIQFHLFAVHHEKSFVCALFKASVDHLFDNLESGKSLAQATFVQKMDSAIHQICLSPVDSPIPSCCGQKCCCACIVLTFYFLKAFVNLLLQKKVLIVFHQQGAKKVSFTACHAGKL